LAREAGESEGLAQVLDHVRIAAERGSRTHGLADGEGIVVGTAHLALPALYRSFGDGDEPGQIRGRELEDAPGAQNGYKARLVPSSIRGSCALCSGRLAVGGR